VGCQPVLGGQYGWTGQGVPKGTIPFIIFPLDLFESNSNNSNLLKFVVNQMNLIKI
jgi:hypothetical protein